MSHWSDIPDALPPEAVASIWEEVGDDVLTITGKTEAFVRIAIDHPHYATAAEIARALAETYNRINPIVFRMKEEARLARNEGLKSGT